MIKHKVGQSTPGSSTINNHIQDLTSNIMTIMIILMVKDDNTTE